jgi:hypothetical protein
VKGLGTAKYGSHRFDRSTHNIVVGVLLGQRPARGLAVCAEHAALWVFGIREIFLDELSPQLPCSAQLCDLHVKVHSDREEERDSRRDLVHIQASLLCCPEVLNTVSKGESKFELAVSTSLLHMVT